MGHEEKIISNDLLKLVNKVFSILFNIRIQIKKYLFKSYFKTKKILIISS